MEECTKRYLPVIKCKINPITAVPNLKLKHDIPKRTKSILFLAGERKKNVRNFSRTDYKTAIFSAKFFHGGGGFACFRTINIFFVCFLLFLFPSTLKCLYDCELHINFG